jgi:hypothetical protein
VAVTAQKLEKNSLSAAIKQSYEERIQQLESLLKRKDQPAGSTSRRNNTIVRRSEMYVLPIHYENTSN